MKGKSHRWVISFIAGALVTAIPLGLFLLNKSHHYAEYSTFFRGTLGEQQVVGIAFVEYDGVGMMELIQWKVQMVDRDGQRVTLYQKSSVFQEMVPHQPKIEIGIDQIQIDDGENKMAITIHHSSKDGV